MGNNVPVPPAPAVAPLPMMGNKEVSEVVVTEHVQPTATPNKTESCPLLAKTPTWVIAHCLERTTSLTKQYWLYPCSFKELGHVADNAFLIEGVLNLKNPPPEVNEWNKHIPCAQR